jgi:pectate lyase
MRVFTFVSLLGVALAFPKGEQLGFSTENGGTTGGKGGVVKYVNTAEGLIEAVQVRINYADSACFG